MPLYAQLERAIKFAIATERLRIGDQLPTVRQMAIELKINANTVAKVYAELERQGILETRRGIGTFVRMRQNPTRMRELREEREKELQQFAERVAGEAYSHGFALDELIDQLSRRRRKGE